jgi:Flp pilus assembly protein TadD
LDEVIVMRLFYVLTLVALLPVTSGLQAAGDDSSSTPSSTEMSSAIELIKNKRFDDAVPVLESVLKSDAYNADAWNLLGYSLRKMKKYALAEKKYLKALAIDFRHIGAMEYLGELYVETGRPKLAQEMLVKLQTICSSGCEELNELRAAISGYQTN